MIFETGEVMEAHVPAAAIVGVVAGEHVHEGADRRAEDVARAVAEDLQAGAVWAETYDAAAAMLEVFAIGSHGIHEAEVTTGDVKPAVDAHAEAVRGVIGGAVSEAERDAFDERLFLISHAVAVFVNVDADVWRVDEVEAVVIPNQATRRVHVFDELGDLIRAAVAIGIT